jgi:hypothetical protein
MANYGSPSVKIEFDNAGGTLVDMSAYCVKDFSINRKANTIDSTPYGEVWAQHIASGMKSMEPITLPVVYDDTATTGPEVIFYNAGAALASTRTFKITYGGTKTTSVECIITGFEVQLSVGQFHAAVVSLQPTGEVTET